MARNFPSQQFGFYLPVYKDDIAAARSIKRVVLRSFAEWVREQKRLNDLFVVKDFQWIVHNFDDNSFFKSDWHQSYAWKAEIIGVRLNP